MKWRQSPDFTKAVYKEETLERKARRTTFAAEQMNPPRAVRQSPDGYLLGMHRILWRVSRRSDPRSAITAIYYRSWLREKVRFWEKTPNAGKRPR